MAATPAPAPRTLPGAKSSGAVAAEVSVVVNGMFVILAAQTFEALTSQIVDSLAFFCRRRRSISHDAGSVPRITTTLGECGKLQGGSKWIGQTVIVHSARVVDQMRTQMKLYRRLPLAPVPDTLVCGGPGMKFIFHHVPPTEAQRKHILLGQLPADGPTWRGVATMTIHSDDALKAIGMNAATYVGDQRLKGLQLQRDRASETHVVVRET